jgi:hypothetical protein
MFTTRQREELFLRLASEPNGITAPDVAKQAATEGDKVTPEAYQNLARRLVHRGVLVADDSQRPTRYRPGQNVDGGWLEEEDLASIVSEDYPLLAIPIWKESLRQIQHMPEEWWAYLRGKLEIEDARDLFFNAITSYCEDLSALVNSQVEFIDKGAHEQEIRRTSEEGRAAVLLLVGLVRFGLGLSIEAVTLPVTFDDAVSEKRKNPSSPNAARCNPQLLRDELAWRIEPGPLIRDAVPERNDKYLIAAVDGSTRTGVMSYLGEDSDFYVGQAPMITVNTAIGLVNRDIRMPDNTQFPAFTRLPEKPEDMQQRDNKYTVMTKLFFSDLSDAEYMHSLWNGMDVLEARATRRVLQRWYTTPGNVEMAPADVVLRDGTVVPQDRDFSHYRDDGSYGSIVRDMIEQNWEIAKKSRDDDQTVMGVVKSAQLRVFAPVINWFVAQRAAKGDVGPVEAWPMRALNGIPDQVLLTRLLTARRTPSDIWSRSAIVIRPFHATTNFAKRYKVNETPVELIHVIRGLDARAAEISGSLGYKTFWENFRDKADPYVQMLRKVAYANFFVAPIPRLEVERYLPRIEFMVTTDVYPDDMEQISDPHPSAQAHLKRALTALAESGFDVSLEHSMFRDRSTLEVLPELVSRAHDTVKTWARELTMRLEEFLGGIIGDHVQRGLSRGIKIRPFSRRQFEQLHQSLLDERNRIAGGSGQAELPS